MGRNGQLTVYEERLPQSLQEQLTLQFYGWERRGRGWQLWDQPVDLEPPFRSFHYYVPDAPISDDGRRDTWLSSLTQRIRDGLLGVPDVQAVAVDVEPELLEPEQAYLRDEDNLVEFQIALSPDQNVTKVISEHFVLNLSYCSGPISFEVVGTGDSIVVQYVCRERDAAQVRQQVHAHFPEAMITQTQDFLRDRWDTGFGVEAVVVDFGLSQEFVRPLDTFRNFDVDPLIGIVGSLNDLRDRELGVLQVIFQPARSPWAQSIFRSVTDWEGRSFFVDAPEMVPLAKEKISYPLYAAVIRVAAQSPQSGRAWEIGKALGSGLAQYTRPASNELIPLTNDDYPHDVHEQDLLLRQSHRSGMLLNSDELVCMAHLPSTSVRSERLQRHVTRSKAAPPIACGHELVLGENTHNGRTVEVSLNTDQRTKHMYVIGASGTGKSTFLLDLIAQDIESGQGLAVLDPHGDLIDQVLERIPEERHADVIVLDPSDEEYPIGFNILSAHSELEKNLISSDLVAVFHRLSTSWGDQMTTVLSNAILAFLESERGGTLSDLRRFLVEKPFRREFLQTVKDRDVVYYWEKEFPILSGRPQGPILTRLDAFLRPKLIRHMVAQEENRLDFADIMNSGKIFLAKLSQGAIGEENAYLLGTLLVSKFHQLTLSRQELQESERRPFYLYIDEFHNFITPSMASILSGVRKYRLGLVLAHQELRQVEKRDAEVASAALSNPYTRVCFRVGDSDARKLADGFAFFESSDLQNLSTGQAIARVERADFDFNLRTPLPPRVEESLARERRTRVIEQSRQRYATPKADVEAFLDERWAQAPLPPVEERAPRQQEEKPEPAPQPQAKVVEPRAPVKPPRPKAVPAEPALMGKGGQEHKYLQQLIKRWAEGMGYRATIEKQLPDGSSIDVALEKETVSIACEISVTTSPDHEVANLKKCLDAGFDFVVAVSADPKKLTRIESQAVDELSSDEIERASFFAPEDLFRFIESIEAQNATREDTVRGYKVRVNYGVPDEQDKNTRKRAVSQVILGAMRRMRGRSKGD